MTSAQVVETSVNVISNSPSQDYTHPDDRTLLYVNLIIYGDSKLALIAFPRTSTRRKYKQVGGQGAALPNTSL